MWTWSRLRVCNNVAPNAVRSPRRRKKRRREKSKIYQRWNGMSNETLLQWICKHVDSSHTRWDFLAAFASDCDGWCDFDLAYDGCALIFRSRGCRLYNLANVNDTIFPPITWLKERTWRFDLFFFCGGDVVLAILLKVKYFVACKIDRCLPHS